MQGVQLVAVPLSPCQLPFHLLQHGHCVEAIHLGIDLAGGKSVRGSLKGLPFRESAVPSGAADAISTVAARWLRSQLRLLLELILVRKVATVVLMLVMTMTMMMMVAVAPLWFLFRSLILKLHLLAAHRAGVCGIIEVIAFIGVAAAMRHSCRVYRSRHPRRGRSGHAASGLWGERDATEAAIGAEVRIVRPVSGRGVGGRLRVQEDVRIVGLLRCRPRGKR